VPSGLQSEQSGQRKKQIQGYDFSFKIVCVEAAKLIQYCKF